MVRENGFYRRSMMFLTISLIFSGAAFDAASQVKVNQHELLRGASVMPDEKSWPDTITLPKAWEDGFRELAERTRRTGLEQGACLQLASDQSTPEQMAQLTEDLLQYAQLRDGSDTATAERKMREIRARFQQSGVKSGGTKYSLGLIQSGEKSSILVHSDVTQCPASALGIVHTHPQAGLGAEAPSPRDMRNLLARQTAINTLSAVVGLNGRACLMIAGPTGYFFKEDYSYRAAIERLYKWSLLAMDVGYRFWTSEQAKGMATNLASHLLLAEAYLRTSGRAGMYCGELGQPFARVLSPVRASGAADRNRALVLYSKAAALMWSALSEQFEATEPFAFNDELDPQYLQYLRRRIKPSDEALKDIQAGEYDVLWATQHNVQLPLPDGSTVQPFQYMEMTADGTVQFPDYMQYGPLMQRMQRSFGFYPIAGKELLFFLVEVSPDRQMVTYLAMFKPHSKEWYRFNPRTSELTWYEPAKGTLTRGRAVLAQCDAKFRCPKFNGPAEITDASGTRRVDIVYKATP